MTEKANDNKGELEWDVCSVAKARDTKFRLFKRIYSIDRFGPIGMDEMATEGAQLQSDLDMLEAEGQEEMILRCQIVTNTIAFYITPLVRMTSEPWIGAAWQK